MGLENRHKSQQVGERKVLFYFLKSVKKVGVCGAQRTGSMLLGAWCRLDLSGWSVGEASEVGVDHSVHGSLIRAVCRHRQKVVRRNQ